MEIAKIISKMFDNENNFFLNLTFKNQRKLCFLGHENLLNFRWIKKFNYIKYMCKEAK